MGWDAEQKVYLIGLIDEISEAVISKERLAELDALLKNQPLARQAYLEYTFLNSGLQRSLKASEYLTEAKLQDNGDLNLYNKALAELAEEEATAPTVKIPHPKQENGPFIIQKVRKERTVRTINKTSLTLAIVSLAAMLIMVLYIHLVPPASYEVATISDSMDAVWSSSLPTKAGTRLSSHAKPIQLTRGVVTFMTDNGVAVVLEAPTEFTFISYSEVALNYGKLFARVSEQGRGFSVATPNAKIVDLGTEFGILSHIDGNTEVYMYEGQASLFAGQKNEQKVTTLLTAGAAQKVNRTDSAVETIPFEEHVVVRRIDSKTQFLWRGEPLNLADILGGGSGFGGGRPDRGIDPLTGEMIGHLATIGSYRGPETYISVPSNPYVDGVFVPGMDSSGTAITSSGITTQEFPQTSGDTWGYIFNGAWHDGLDVPRHALQLNGTALDGRKQPAMTMHSNLGMTFDLAAIRRILPGLEIKAFSSAFGISETVHRWLDVKDFSVVADMPNVGKLAAERKATAEFWVFLDGRMVLRQTVSSMDKAAAMEIAIPDDTRFLTIAVTEADDTFMFDWTVFADPKLLLDAAGDSSNEN